MTSDIPPELHRFDDDGRFPNSLLPLLIYRRAVLPTAAAIERVFAAHGWSNAWRNGVYDYHHFHSIAHEVLGMASGEARVTFGGPFGKELTLRAGDVVVIPAGVAHCNTGRTDFLVVGAYPGGADWDVRKGEAFEHAAAIRAIAAVPLPQNDPVAGPDGPLRRLWTPA